MLLFTTLLRGCGLSAPVLLIASILSASPTAAISNPDHDSLLAGSASDVPAAESLSSRLFMQPLAEPLVATGPTKPEEDHALWQAVAAYERRTDPDDFSALTGFVSAHADSAWRSSVLTNLGIAYLHYGWYAKALDAWEAAWQAGREATGFQARAFVDRAVGELVQLHARFGHQERLEALLQELGDRPVSGPATESVAAAKAALWAMRNQPEKAFLCGPMALRALAVGQAVASEQLRLLNRYKAGPKGTSLAEVAELAHQVGIDYRAVFRAPGQAVPIPSIVHWKVGHFATITGERDGRYRVNDPSLGAEVWVTKAALDAEASGYFLAPAGSDPDAAGWRLVAAEEAAKVFGAGTPPQKKSCPPCTVYSIDDFQGGLLLADTPVGYDPQKGPSVRTRLSYNQKDAAQPANFNFFNIGPKWTLGWQKFIQDDPTMAGANVSQYAEGVSVGFIGFNPGTGAFAASPSDASVLTQTATSPVSYTLSLPDGGSEIYSQSDGSTSFPRRVFLTKIVDPQGNALTLAYNASLQLTSLTDATGRATTFTYGNASFPLVVTAIADPFGRTAKLTYDASGRLASITDVIGLVSSFTYNASSLVAALKTPYGTTNFNFGDFSTGATLPLSGPYSFFEATDPLGNTERVEYGNTAPGIPFSDPANTVPSGIVAPFNQYLNSRNSFHWDAHAYKLAGCTANGGCDYTDARITHYTHLLGDVSTATGVVESIKNPLENRIWFNYPGQSSATGLGTADSGSLGLPSGTGRVLDDGTTQLTRVTYNAAGNPVSFTDAIGRETQLTYAANQIDVVAVAQKTASGFQTAAKYSYNTHHRPLTYTGATGQITTYTYNTAQELASVTDPLGHKTTLNYDTHGRLTSVINPNGVTQQSFTYSSADQIASTTDSEGRTVKYAYDDADRRTKITYPDGTTRILKYSKLDLASATDRQGRITKYAYDADRHLTSVTDPLGHKTDYAYFENGILKSETDPNGHVTAWDIDAEGRPTAKHFAGGATFQFTYEKTTSRLKSLTDALGQVKQLRYALDDRLAGINYVNAVHTTPDVSFTYDPQFPRLTARTDGSGTTTYQYVPIGTPGATQVQQETGPLTNAAIRSTYDALGRVVSRTIGGSDPVSYRYDTLGRLIGETNALGGFTLDHLGQTDQVTTQQLGGTAVATIRSYLSNTDDRRLAAIDNKAGRKFQFTTTPENQFSAIGETDHSFPAAGTTSGPTQTLSYDNDSRVLGSVSSAGPQFTYTYDAGDNITKATSPSGTATATYAPANQIATFQGKAFSYDANGNLLSDGQRDYQWDAENRLIDITYVGQAGKETSFSYDGLNRRVAITTTPSGGGTPVATHYLWCGERICQSRTASGAVARLYFSQGEVVPSSNTKLYYGLDQISSVRNVLAVTPDFQTVQTYDYDPYGNPTKTPATGVTADFRFAGLFFHADSGLYLTQFRAYDPRTGHWLSRDPAGEESHHYGVDPARAPIGAAVSPGVEDDHARGVFPGTNLYQYAQANPIGLTDRSGLGVDQECLRDTLCKQALFFFISGGVAAQSGLNGAAAIGVRIGGVGFLGVSIFSLIILEGLCPEYFDPVLNPPVEA